MFKSAFKKVTCSICNIEIENTENIYGIKYLILGALKWFYFCERCLSAIESKYGFLTWRESFNKQNSLIPFYQYYFKGAIINDIKDMESFKKEIVETKKRDKKKAEERQKRREREAIIEVERITTLKKSIIQLLKDKPIKMPTSDIDAHLKHRNLDEIKALCEELYNDGEISFAGNGRYFILSEEKKKPKPKKTSAPKSEAVDVKAELKKYKEMLDDGLITQEQYDAKSNELLGL